MKERAAREEARRADLKARLAGKLLIEVDGPGVHLHNVDPLAFLEFAAAFLALVLENATESKSPLLLTRVRLIEKCAGLYVLPNLPDLAVSASREVAGIEEPPHGAGQFVDRVRQSITLFPAASKFQVQLDDWVALITDKPPMPERPLDSMLSLRARPVRVGGKVPRARFSSLLEPDEFTLRVNEDQARKLGAMLYRDAEIVAFVRRAPDGSIEDGTLKEFTLVEDRDAIDAWRTWGGMVRRKAT